MYYLVLAIHIVVCLFLIIVILLQSGKAADLAGAFGGMGSQTAFGPRGSATLLSKATTASAAIFMVTSMALSILATRNAGLSTTVLEDQPLKSTPARTVPIPVTPGRPAPDANTKTIQVPLPKQTKENTGHPVQVTIPATPPAKK
jgi:preprotein translocase subunit SecG